MVAGTFDILHPGHSFLINEAAKLGEVYVIVARDSNAKKFRGIPPTIGEDQRLEMVQGLKNVKNAVLGHENSDYFKIFEEIKPDIIMLGPNQKVKIEQVKEGLREKGLDNVQIIRLDELYDKYELNSSTSIKQKIMKNHLESQNGK